ncbi:MAG TPA: acetyltransferase [Lactobacillaceae bacterium]|jgi:acetyltransferase-like isoleucine patch superfamily enzyme
MVNRYVMIRADGTEVENPTITGLKVHFFGDGNLVKITEGSVFHGCTVNISNESTLIIHRTHPVGLKYVTFAMAGQSWRNYVEIGENFSVAYTTRFALENTDDARVMIGRNNMWSSEIVIRASDGHQIIDIVTNQVINQAKAIIIGNHVWLGSQAVILKGAVIPDNTIVGQSAVVAGQFTETFTVLAGNSARVVRRGVTWNRKYVIESQLP